MPTRTLHQNQSMTIDTQPTEILVENLDRIKGVCTIRDGGFLHRVEVDGGKTKRVITTNFPATYVVKNIDAANLKIIY